MKTALLLGAGASAFASQPTTREIMELLRDQVRQLEDEDGLDEGLQNYIMGIVEDYTYDDIEELYDGIDRVINITTNHNSKPIISNMGDQEYGVIDAKMIDGLVSLRSMIRKTLRGAFGINSDAQESIKDMYDMVWSIIKGSGTKEFRVFTTNYDLVVETYANGAGFEIINGFKPYHYRSGFWANIWDRGTDLPPLYLTKMHGSIYWHRDADGKIVETGSVADVDVDSDIMIAPTMGAKDYNREPFAALIDRFKAAIREVDVLLVIGFSYRDDEIVNIIKNEMENGMALISVSLDADTSVPRISDTEMETTEINGEYLKVVGPRIVLCDIEFGPYYVGELRTALDTAYAFIRPSIKRGRRKRGRRRNVKNS